MHDAKVVFVTGAARRVGATIVRFLHEQGMNVVLHYRNAQAPAMQLADELLRRRSGSVLLLQADLSETKNLANLIEQIIAHFGRLDALINNASSFYPTPVENATEEQWHDLFSSNLVAPFFLAKHAFPHLQQQQGCIVNIADVHAIRPLKNYPIYCMAKAGLIMQTKCLAKEFAPKVRVNAIAPGTIIWPENESSISELEQAQLIRATPLLRIGDPSDIAKTALFLIQNAPFITGQTIAVDGGRSLG